MMEVGPVGEETSTRSSNSIGTEVKQLTEDMEATKLSEFEQPTTTTTTTTSTDNTSVPSTVDVKILQGQSGIANLANDVLYHKPCTTSDIISPSHVIFFGGDVQALKEVMEAHRDNWRYKEWCLENVCKILSDKFCHDHIWVVKANSMFLNTFAMYEFLPLGQDTTPEHNEDGCCVEHIATVIKNCIDSITQGPSNKNATDLTSLPIKLVGFSKGCTVLNQILYEFKKPEPICRQFLDRIEIMYWLDGGHAGGTDTWVTDDECVSEIPRRNIRVRVHVTPYQVDDPNRAWVGKEERKFVSKLRRLRANIRERKHFEEEPRSIENHFKVISTFAPDE